MHRKFLNNISSILIIGACVLAFVLAKAYAQDKIIAIVDNAVITQKEFDDFLSFMRLQLASEKEYSPQELENKVQSIKQDLLEKLIEDKLILQEAKKSNVKIEDSLIKARMLQIRKRYGSEEEFQRSLAIQGFTEADIEEKIREQAAMYNIIEQKVKSQITISPSEVTDFYYENFEQFQFPEERSLKYIKTPDNNIARKIEAGIKKGEDLASAAKKESLEMNTLTVSSKEKLKAELKEAIFNLKAGETSQAVSSEEYYYVFALQEIAPARQQNLPEVQDAIHRFLFEKKMQEKLTSWLDELRKNSYVNIIHS